MLGTAASPHLTYNQIKRIVLRKFISSVMLINRQVLFFLQAHYKSWVTLKYTGNEKQ